ncbi:acyl-CoA dehydrogenase family protein [Rhizorhabdus histidinilytica]|uniref:acyl-CoA dehydrogenase family protein n=1 Tax=Rhizorhabdus histidinilytica TaxID=439228 RepID=UPI00322062E6
MDFTASNEQEMLRDSARRFFADREGDRHASAWGSYADLGWLALVAPEDAGGIGGDIEDILILAEEMGRALAHEPYAGSAIVAMRLIDRTADGDARRELLAAMADGSIRVAPALYEPGRRYALSPSMRATGDGGGFRLSGAKILVSGGGDADRLLLSATLDDGTIGLFLVDPAATGTTVSRYATIDDGAVADVAFDAFIIGSESLLGRIDIEAIDDALDDARLALCADALGGLERAIAMTSDYLSTRSQFGQPLASFQALQHSLVEIFIDTDSIRSSLYQAVAAVHDGDGVARRRAISSCWVKTFGAAKRIAGTAVHLHGGIGMTTEYQVGHYLRRMMVSERSFGDVEHHLARYMALST